MFNVRMLKHKYRLRIQHLKAHVLESYYKEFARLHFHTKRAYGKWKDLILSVKQHSRVDNVITL